MKTEQLKINGWNRQEDSLLRVGKNGLIKEDRVIKENEIIDIKDRRKNLTVKQKALLNQNNELKNYCKELGGYIHMAYVKKELLFNKINIDRANISRLIYLSTHIDYNNRHENLLIKYRQHKQMEPMTRADLKKILGLSDTTFKSFISDMKKSNLIYEDDKKFYISTDYFSKGECNFNNKEYTRIFVDTTKILYENCTSRQHKQLSYVFQLIPFLHFETNILCANPKEIDLYKLEKLSLKNICEMLGVSTEKKSMNKFENDLYKLQVNIDGSKHYLFKRVIVKGGNGVNDYFIVNPKVTWSGRDIEKVKETIQVCFFK